MKEGELLYFTQAELEVMLDLSGGAAHTLFRAGPPPDDNALTQAFASLYRRGFLTRRDRSLSPTQRGGFFRDMHKAPLAVALTARYPMESEALCYGGGETLWLCETVRTALSEQVRLRQFPRERLQEWLYDTGILDPPFLTAEDTRELSELTREEPSGDTVRLRLEKYENGGKLLGVYEVLSGNGLPLVRVREDERDTAELYTVETLRDMLARCFRQERETIADAS